MTALLLALQWMTRLPLPALRAEPRDLAAAMAWFPAAGLVVGGTVAGAAWLGAMRDPWAGALFALVGWVGVTGALHLDGLGDIADAAGAAHGDRARLSAVLADPHIGSFGVVVIALQLLAKLVLLRLELSGAVPFAGLILIAMLARVGPIGWALTLAPLHEGMGTLVGAGARWRHGALWLALLVPLALLSAPAALASLLALPLWRHWLATRIGGVSGDGHGAGIELAETAGLIALVFLP